MNLKKTPFYSLHIRLNAKMVPFAGFEMPLQYAGIIKETLHTRQKVSFFDVSHMGEIKVRGKSALSFLNRMVSSDISSLNLNRAQYSLLMNEKGGVVDDLLIYKKGEEDFLLVVNAANIDKDFTFLIEHKDKDEIIKNISEEVAQLAIQGPDSKKLLEDFFGRPLSMKFYHFEQFEYKGIPLLVSRTGYTGELGFEIYTDRRNALPLFEMLEEKGKEYDLQPAGLGARDTLRLEMGYPLYGHELDDETSPIEASLNRFVKLNKSDFLGKDRLLKGPTKKLIAFYSEEKGNIPREKSKILDRQQREIGYVTSGGFSPSLNYPIGMGYVPYDFEDSEIFILVRKKLARFNLTSLPFVKKTTLKISKK